MRKREPMEIMVEREACAQIAERLAMDLSSLARIAALTIAEEIRARSGADDDHGRIK
jgi:hypothetical protein